MKYKKKFITTSNSHFEMSSRKTCQACKCPRENHEIYHEQLQNVKERLGFKIDSKTSQIDAKKLGYTWTPPGVSDIM